MMKSIPVIGWAGLALLLAGCSTASETKSEQTIPVPLHLGADALEDPNAVAPDEFTNARGVRFVPFDREALRAETDIPDVPSEEMTAEQLAQSLRAVTIFRGREYIAAEPAYEAAQRVKQGIAPGGNSYNPFKDEDEPELEAGLGQAQQAAIIDTDTRTSKDSTYPYSTMIAFSGNSAMTDPECSGTLIGPSTAITTAQCFHSGSGGSFHPTRSWAPGADKDDPVDFPFGAWTGCYFVYIPFGWTIGAGSYIDYDYAAMEFNDPNACSLSPGNSAGWIGYWNVSNSDITGSSVRVSGYPDDKPQWPSLWYDAESITGIPANGAGSGSPSFKFQTDLVPSQSGAAAYGYFTPTGGGSLDYYAKGVANRLAVNNYNGARRMDSTYINFIATYTNL